MKVAKEVVLVPLETGDIGSGWRVYGDPGWNEPDTFIDVESDGDVADRPIFILTSYSKLWGDDPQNIGLSLEGAVALIVALEREIARDPRDAEQVDALRARFKP